MIDCASASAPFLNRLSGADRVVVTATRSGSEQNFARFGEYLAEAIADPRADLDKDGQVSLLEAYLIASSRTAEFYKSRSRLATEHALLDDNGDQPGHPRRLVQGRPRHPTGQGRRPARRPPGPPAPADPQRPRAGHPPRGPPEAEPARAGRRRPPRPKAKLPEADYYARLEPLMVELARLYRDLPASTPGPNQRRRTGADQGDIIGSGPAPCPCEMSSSRTSDTSNGFIFVLHRRGCVGYTLMGCLESKARNHAAPA